MSRERAGGSWFDKLIAQAHDYLPHFGVLPQLTPAEVERYVALGTDGTRRLREGDAAGAEAAFRAQLSIFSLNPEPHVSLAVLAERRRDEKAAIEHLTDAVLRGFDLPSVARAEAWIRLRKNDRFLALQDVVPILQANEAKWGGWNLERAEYAPRDVAGVLQGHERVSVLVEQMAPALGPRLTRLWKLRNDRAAAALLEAYVAERPQAPDLDVALARLMDLYTGGTFLQWGKLPPEVARRLKAVSDLALARFPEGPMRPGALVCRALGRYSERDAKGNLPASEASLVRQDLNEVLALSPVATFIAVAVEGLVRSEAESGRMDRAAEHYKRFRQAHASDAALLASVRNRLGVLGLRAGGLPDIRTVALDGVPLGPEELRGKVVILDFWATWCGPCLEELPTLRRIVERHGEEVIVIGVNLDWADDFPKEDLVEWVAREKVPGRQIHEGLSWDSELVKAFGVKEIPMSVVAGPDGAIVAMNEHGKQLEKTVRVAAAALKAAKP